MFGKSFIPIRQLNHITFYTAVRLIECSPFDIIRYMVKQRDELTPSSYTPTKSNSTDSKFLMSRAPTDADSKFLIPRAPTDVDLKNFKSLTPNADDIFNSKGLKSRGELEEFFAEFREYHQSKKNQDAKRNKKLVETIFRGLHYIFFCFKLSDLDSKNFYDTLREVLVEGFQKNQTTATKMAVINSNLKKIYNLARDQRQEDYQRLKAWQSSESIPLPYVPPAYVPSSNNHAETLSLGTPEDSKINTIAKEDFDDILKTYHKKKTSGFLFFCRPSTTMTLLWALSDNYRVGDMIPFDKIAQIANDRGRETHFLNQSISDPRHHFFDDTNRILYMLAKGAGVIQDGVDFHQPTQYNPVGYVHHGRY